MYDDHKVFRYEGIVSYGAAAQKRCSYRRALLFMMSSSSYLSNEETILLLLIISCQTMHVYEKIVYLRDY